MAIVYSGEPKMALSLCMENQVAKSGEGQDVVRTVAT